MEAPLAMDCYEDMFKEITRKLYGEDDMATGNPRVHVPATTEYEHAGDGSGTLAAFGLAALMQNGFQPAALPHPNPQDRWVSSDESLPWTASKVASYNPAQRAFRCAECDSVGSLARVAEHWLGAHANLRVFQCPQCPYSSAWARCVRMHLARQHNVAEDSMGPLHKESPALQEVTKFLQRLRARIDSTPPLPLPLPVPPPPTTPKQEPGGGGNKRYCCAFCPYATDRRDLFTRHENIHREEKPFQCYVCQKQFNRADHVKKHFLRMHRDYPYDLNRIRRQPPKNGSGMYYHKYGSNGGSPSPGGSSNNNNNNSNNANNNQHGHQMLVPPPHSIHQPHLHPGLNIPGGFGSMDMRAGANCKPKSPVMGCNAKSHGSKTKKKGEKRYSCCYCSWSGVDNWCLKRHLNTHLKPFVCVLCDYKAARSERLATHVLKVHNKRACSRCSFLADDQAQLTMHLQEHHPLEHRNNRSSNNILRNVGFPSHAPAMSTPFGYQAPGMVKREQYESSYHHHEGGGRPSRHWGAARLFHYMEASDTSDQDDDDDEEGGGGADEADLPEFVCRECGCEFVDDTSLETHSVTHLRAAAAADRPYVCSICGWGMASQAAMMDHMRGHSGMVTRCHVQDCSFSTALGEEALRDHVAAAHERGGLPDPGANHALTYHNGSKRPRKQSQPRRVVPDCGEARVVHGAPGRRSGLARKYAEQLLSRRRVCCEWCRQDAFPYHTVSSLAFHRCWRHYRPRFRCEHCGDGFRHRYQVVLHSSRQHVSQLPTTVPEREEQPSITTVPAPTESSLSKINVPDLLLHTPEPVHTSTPPSHLGIATLCGSATSIHHSSLSNAALPSSLSSATPS